MISSQDYSGQLSTNIKTSQSNSSLNTFGNDDDVFYDDNIEKSQKMRQARNSSSSDSDVSTVVASSPSTNPPKLQVHANQNPTPFHRTSSSQSSIGSAGDTETHNVIFGVPLRRLNTISWGVKQKRYWSPETEPDDEQVPPSPVPVKNAEKFNTFPRKVTPIEIQNEFKASTVSKRSGGAVKSKIISGKLGDKESPRYHSQSDLTTADFGAPTTWRRKSISDDMFEMNNSQPLTRRPSISDLLKLYRTKSQTDLSQIDAPANFLSTPMATDELQPKKTATPVAAPLKMSDLKINPMSKPKLEPYKPSTKDIVRLPANRKTIEIKPQNQSNISDPPKTEKISVNEKTIERKPQLQRNISDPPKVKDAAEKVEIEQKITITNTRPKIYAIPGQHFHKPLAAKPPMCVTSTKSTRVVQAAVPQIPESPKASQDENAKKLTKMLTPTPYTKYSDPVVINRNARTVSTQSSSSCSSDEDEKNRHLNVTKTQTERVPQKESVSLIKNTFNRNRSEPVFPIKRSFAVSPKDQQMTKQTDDIDGIPHDEKIPSFVVPFSKEQKKTNEHNTVKTYPKYTANQKPSHLMNTDKPDGVHTNKIPEANEDKQKKPSQQQSQQNHLENSLKSRFAKMKLHRSSSSSSTSSIEGREEKKSESPTSNFGWRAESPTKVSNWKEKAKTMIDTVLSSSESSGDEAKSPVFVIVNKQKDSDSGSQNVPVDKKRYDRLSASSSSGEEKVTVTKSTNLSSQPTEHDFNEKKDNYSTEKPTKIPQAKPKRFYQKETETPQQNEKQPIKPEPKVTVKGETLTPSVNFRSEPRSQLMRETSSSEYELKQKATKIPIFNHNSRKHSSTSEDEAKIVNNSPAKKTDTVKNSKTDGEGLVPGDSRKSSSAESFQDFDPYAIGRMIVRGSRKSTSDVKRPENLTNIRNASVPINSPFSPLKDTTRKTTATTLEPAQRKRSSSSSSSSSDDSLSLKIGDHDGIYSASMTLID